jgi:hypothetical protein
MPKSAFADHGGQSLRNIQVRRADPLSTSARQAVAWRFCVCSHGVPCPIPLSRRFRIVGWRENEPEPQRQNGRPRPAFDSPTGFRPDRVVGDPPRPNGRPARTPESGRGICACGVYPGIAIARNRHPAKLRPAGRASPSGRLAARLDQDPQSREPGLAPRCLRNTREGAPPSRGGTTEPQPRTVGGHRLRPTKELAGSGPDDLPDRHEPSRRFAQARPRQRALGGIGHSLGERSTMPAKG